MKNTDKSNSNTQVKSASNWAIGLGILKLLLGLGSIFILEMDINSIFELNAITVILTIVVGGLMVMWGMRLREGHVNTTNYLNYLIIVISVSLVLGVIAVQGVKIAINAWGLYIFIQARKQLKSTESSEPTIN